MGFGGVALIPSRVHSIAGLLTSGEGFTKCLLILDTALDLATLVSPL